MVPMRVNDTAGPGIQPKPIADMWVSPGLLDLQHLENISFRLYDSLQFTCQYVVSYIKLGFLPGGFSDHTAARRTRNEAHYTIILNEAHHTTVETVSL